MIMGGCTETFQLLKIVVFAEFEYIPHYLFVTFKPPLINYIFEAPVITYSPEYLLGSRCNSI